MSVTEFISSSSDEFAVGTNAEEIEDTVCPTSDACVETGTLTTSAEYDTGSATDSVDCASASDPGEWTLSGMFVEA